MSGWQVYSYAGNYGGTHGGDIPGRVLFGGEVFTTRREAEAAWYDTHPGRNDRARFRRKKCEGDSKRTGRAKRLRVNRKQEREGKEAITCRS